MLRAAHLLCFLLFSCCLVAQQTTYDTRPWDITKIPNGKYRFKSDTLRLRGHVRELKEIGQWIFERKNGYGKWYVSEVRNYWRGELNGQYFVFTGRGDTLVAGNYHKGKQIGQWKYFEEGRVSDIVSYDSRGNRTGEQLRLLSDGSIAARWYYTDSAHCFVWFYFGNGQISKRGEMVNGNYSGTWYHYLGSEDTNLPADTLPFVIVNYNDEGYPHGPTFHYNHGQLVEEENYKNGTLDGPQRTYQNGDLLTEYWYKEGRADGPQRSFFPNGNPNWEIVYRNNELIARHQYDTLTGKIVESSYFTGPQMDSNFYYTREGKLVYCRRVISFKEHTYEEKRFYENGMCRDSCRTYAYERTGEFHSWYANGKTHVISHHNAKGYCGALDVWNEKGVRVIHALPSRNRDTVPEQVWSDKGVRLNPGTKAYSDQLDKYLVSAVERYEDSVFYLNGVVITAIHLPGDHTPRQATQIEVVDSIATNGRTAPAFPGGVRGFQNYLMKNILYPPQENELGKYGSVWITFTVNTDSTVSDVYPLKVVSGAPGLDREAIRVIRMMPKWSPAMKGGKPYKSSCVVQVRFELL